MNSQHETIIIVAISAGVFFGSIAGGVTGYMASNRAGLVQPSVDLGIKGLTESEEQGIAGLLKEEQATIAVVDTVKPSVVSIIIEKNFLPNDISASEGEIYQVGGGTGFFVTSDGLILTNRHVVEDDDANYKVITNDGQEYTAKVLDKDVFLDLALLKVNGENFEPVKLGDSDQIKIGQTVVAIGNTLSEFQNSVTKGIVSGLNRSIVAGDGSGSEEFIDKAIQTDAAISEGNSGGPLINLFGEVIGMNTAVSSTGQSLGFAIPINEAKSAIEDVMTEGRIIRPWLGVRYLMINEELKAELDLSVNEGALIIPEEFTFDDSVIQGSPADSVGLLPGDIILNVNNEILTTEFTLGDVINSYQPGDIVSIEVLRGNERMKMDITLAELDESLLK